MNNREKAFVIFIVAVFAGAVIQGTIKHEAAVLGMSAVEVALLGYVAGAAVTRAMKAS
jgi:hypothetical protein